MPVPPSAYVARVRELQESFQLFDLDRNGTISPGELAQVMRQLGQALSPQQAAQIVETYDVNGDGQIEFAEFLRHQLRTLEGQPGPLRAAFAAVDQDGDGFIEPAELRVAIGLLWDGKLSSSQIDELAASADVTGDGRVQLGELVHLLMREE
jgi:Ca2+-binding EF-hand superfamily protein